ncbi:hypothetical protein DFJ63DRAFT_310447 [Scheffersomyces coipomensis]|uniref:uncharacterized protein n=1 Tax=Scheffersomyces coipomensis TaxID=1788519 RepID=UPI00315CFD00
MFSLTLRSRIGINSYSRALCLSKPSSIVLSRHLLHTTPSLSSIFKKAAPTPTSTTSSPTSPATDEVYKTHPILKRVPRFLRRYTTQFIHAPVSHVISFLVLHELTAIVPLISLWYCLYNFPDYFHFIDWSVGSMNEVYVKGVEVINKSLDKYQIGAIDGLEDKVKLLSTGATSYVVVKLLAPGRVVFSLLFMNWFAKWFVVPISNLFKRKKRTPSSPIESSEDTATTVTPPISNSISVKKVDKPRL